MIRRTAPAALAWAMVLAGPSQVQANARCPAAVVLQGDAELVAQATQSLADGGIDVRARSESTECIALFVALRHSARDIELTIRDADRRESRRHVRALRTAIILIESWVRDGLAQALPILDRVDRTPQMTRVSLETPAIPTTAPVPPAPSTSAPAPAVTHTTVPTSPVAATSVSTRVEPPRSVEPSLPAPPIRASSVETHEDRSLAPSPKPTPREGPARVEAAVTDMHEGGPPRIAMELFGEGTLFDDGALALGARAAGALPVGPVELLLRARYYAAPVAQLEAQRSAVGRHGFEALTGIGGAFQLTEGMDLHPALTAGVGWHRSFRPDASDSSVGTSAPLIDDRFSASTISARFEAEVSTALALSSTTRLVVAFSASAAPWAHRTAFIPPYAQGLEEAEAARLGLSGEARFAFRAAAGLRWLP